jgi:hypothetical protein
MPQEYPKCNRRGKAQETLNLIIDYNRDNYKNILQEECESDKNLINEKQSLHVMHDKTSDKE